MYLLEVHDNLPFLTLHEVLDFNESVKLAYEFYKKHPDETLIVVTADHETGGLVLLGGDIEKGRNECKYITDGHSGVMVPVFAFGPGAEQFSGIQNNIDILPKILNIMGRKTYLN